MLFNLLAITLFTLACAYIDWEHLKDHDYIESHASRVVQRFLFCFVLGMPEWNWWVMAGAVLFFAATFDTALNLMRGKGMLYFGKTAIWDKFWSKYKMVYAVLMLVVLWISITILITGTGQIIIDLLNSIESIWR